MYLCILRLPILVLKVNQFLFINLFFRLNSWALELIDECLVRLKILLNRLSFERLISLYGILIDT